MFNKSGILRFDQHTDLVFFIVVVDYANHSTTVDAPI
jgi:hypothetical protein